MFVCVFVCLIACLCVCLFVCLFVCLCICLFVRLCMRVCASLSGCLIVCVPSARIRTTVDRRITVSYAIEFKSSCCIASRSLVAASYASSLLHVTGGPCKGPVGPSRKAAG